MRDDEPTNNHATQRIENTDKLQKSNEEERTGDARVGAAGADFGRFRTNNELYKRHTKTNTKYSTSIRATHTNAHTERT